jgi:O-antigen/teichoic acid export membrane protein
MAETSSIRREIASAYLASGAKILSWVVVGGIVYRSGGSIEFGILSLIRGTIGILNYVSLGLGPATVKMMAEVPSNHPANSNKVLAYHSAEPPGSLRALYSNAVSFGSMTGLVALVALFVYSRTFSRLHHVPADLGGEAGLAVTLAGMGLLLRLISDAPGAVLQTSHRIARDNWLIFEAEVVWLLFTALLMLSRVLHSSALVQAVLGYAVASFFLMIRRVSAAQAIVGRPYWALDVPVIKQIVGIGGLITLAQLADYLYAPTDYILINHFLGAGAVAWYAPAVQIDAGLLVLVSGLAAVLFPRSAMAHAAGDVRAVRKYYVRGTMASAAILIVASGLMWLVSPIFLRLWFGDSMPETRRILPLVLIHTVIGGSAMVGRSVLLAAGKFGVFAGSVLIAGAVNVVVSYALVKAGWGLKGIVMGTIVAVVLRCVVWMPWYVMRALKEVKQIPAEPILVPEV